MSVQYATDVSSTLTHAEPAESEAQPSLKQGFPVIASTLNFHVNYRLVNIVWDHAPPGC